MDHRDRFGLLGECRSGKAENGSSDGQAGNELHGWNPPISLSAS
jgi:hypothetical protein